MYEELVKRLRNCEQFKCKVCDYEQILGCRAKLNKEAADAIEELSAKETPMAVTEIHVDEYYCPNCGAENNCDCGYVYDAYCPVCGQRLWAEEGELCLPQGFRKRRGADDKRASWCARHNRDKG